MNIINAVYGDSTGGRWVATLKTAELLGRAGHAVTLLIDPCDLVKVPETLPPGVQVIALKNSGHYDFIASLRARRLIRQLGIDAIIGHSGRAIWMLKRAAPKQVPVVAFNHSHNIKRTLKADAFFCITPYMQEIVRRSTAGRKPAFVISNAVSVPPDASLQPCPAGNRFTIGMLTRLSPGKGVDLAIEAMALLPDQTQARLVIAGDGEEAERLKRLVDDKGLAHCVEFAGWVSQDGKPGFFNGIDLFCYSSSHDVQPLVVLEAMAWGKAIIGNDLIGASSVYEHGQTAIVVPQRDPQALANAITTLSGDPSLRAQLGARAREFAIAHYSEAAITTALESALGQLVSARLGSRPAPAAQAD